LKTDGPMVPTTTSCTPMLTRRAMLWRLGAAALLLAVWPAGAWTASADVQQAIRQLIGEREPQPGGISLTLPKIAETGNSVALTVAVDSAMTPDDHVQRIHVFVPGNPEPMAATYHLGVRAGKAEISTHIRLARTQTVLALAEMQDGSVRSGSAGIVVTLGACVDEVWTDGK
jgi:sulfur-oxidizing protein SoxY